MIRKIIIIFLVILSLNVVLGDNFYASNTGNIISINNCENILINVTATDKIDNNEYEFVGCEEIYNNSWYCECEGFYELKFKTLINTINEYNFTIIYNYSYNKESSRSKSSSGSRFIGFNFESRFENKTINETETINQKNNINDKNNKSDSIFTNKTINESTTIPPNKSYHFFEENVTFINNTDNETLKNENKKPEVLKRFFDFVLKPFRFVWNLIF